GEWSPLSAVTRPPPPRRGSGSLSAPRAYVLGPRLETTISLRRPAMSRPPYPRSARLTRRRRGRDLGARRVVAVELVQQHQPVAQQPGHEEIAPDELLSAQRALPGRGRVVEDLD